MHDFAFRLDPAARIAVITWHASRPDMRIFRPGFAALLAQPGFEPDFGVISDWRSARDAPDSAFVKDFLLHLESAARRGVFVGPWATIVHRPAVAVYGMGRMTEILSETARLEYAVFTDDVEARAWILSMLARRSHD